MASKLPSILISLAAHLKKFSGVGNRTAERFAFELLSWNKKELESLIKILNELQEKVPVCPECGCLTDESNCFFCKNRDTESLCIIASPREAFSLEATGYKGLYHVINHLLSPIDGKNSIEIAPIIKKIQTKPIKEIILAFDSTLEGDTTALYLKMQLQDLGVSISRLAFGLPVGSSLEYIDSSTLSRAFSGRQTL